MNVGVVEKRHLTPLKTGVTGITFDTWSLKRFWRDVKNDTRNVLGVSNLHPMIYYSGCILMVIDSALFRSFSDVIERDLQPLFLSPAKVFAV